ncbi:MAG TPA: DUF892 family protein [Methylomirabilota bacterium]|jgi:ferritin-like metal-binding protein YciE|nr:DUF892 family protein [Methylomirabilota bacterium]
MPKKKNMNLTDLLILKLKALYDTENRLTKALPKLAKASTDVDLKAAFITHAAETANHVKRLEKIFQTLDLKPQKTTVEAVQGLVADTDWCIKNISGPAALDAALVGAAQYAEHYEIAGYGTALEWAELLDFAGIAQTLEETLEEEKVTDEKLSELAHAKLNDRIKIFN